MCLVLDVNAFHCVFDKASQDYESYKPVFDWVVNGRGKLVMGGTKYHEELGRMQKYIKLLGQLHRKRKIVAVDNDAVDRRAVEIARDCPDADFDDQHIVAILSVTGCKIFCSKDQRSYKYIKQRRWYKNGQPKIYNAKTSRLAGQILIDKNIAEVCMPCCVLNKKDRDVFNN